MIIMVVNTDMHLLVNPAPNSQFSQYMPVVLDSPQSIIIQWCHVDSYASYIVERSTYTVIIHGVLYAALLSLHKQLYARYVEER